MDLRPLSSGGQAWSKSSWSGPSVFFMAFKDSLNWPHDMKVAPEPQAVFNKTRKCPRIVDKSDLGVFQFNRTTNHLTGETNEPRYGRELGVSYTELRFGAVHKTSCQFSDHGGAW